MRVGVDGANASSASGARGLGHGLRARFCCWALAWLLPAFAGATEYRFRDAPLNVNTALTAAVLTDTERAFVAQLPELRVGVPTPAQRPYEVLSPDGEVSGISPDMLTALARTFGLRIRPVVLPDWSSTLRAARERQVDVLMSLGVTAERLDYLAFTVGATPLPGALFARQGAQLDLSTAKFALEREFLANDHVRRQFPAASILTVDTTLDALRAVGAGQADVYLGNLLTASAWLAQQPVPGVTLLQLHGYSTGCYHFAVRKDWAMLATILNKGIQTLRRTPTDDLTALLDASLPKGASLARPLSLPEADALLLAQRPVWRVGAVRGLPMLNDIDINGLHTGIGAEYAEQVGQRLGVAMQVQGFDNVAAMLDALHSGEIDLVPFLTRTPERDKVFTFSKPYIEMPCMLVARSDGPLYWDLDSLRGKRLALAIAHPLRELLAQRYGDIRIVDAANGNNAMDKVARHEAEAAVEVAELPAQFYFAVARQSAELMPLVDKALADIPAAERQRMLRRWVAVDLHRGFAWRRYLPLLTMAAAALLAIAGGTAWWMRRLAREVSARRRSEQLLNHIATTVPGLAFRYVLDSAGQMRQHYFTPGAQPFLGIDLSPRRTVLASLAPRLRPEHLAQALAEQQRCQQSGERFKSTCAYRHPDGRELWLYAEAVHAVRPDGAQVWTGFVVDVSTERALQQQLAQAAQSRHVMLASASHELRAPTHTLSLALQSLSTERLDSMQQDAVRIARASAKTLAQLLDDVLDAARFDPQALTLRPQVVELRSLFDEAAEAWRGVAIAKGLAFELHLAPELPTRALHDPVRLKQIATNLLSNAFKYTASGSVRMVVDVAADGRLGLRVSDTGVGIAAADQAGLFRPFVTGGAVALASPEMGRSGLGLSICRRIALLMAGQIELDSQLGQGTVLTVQLPLNPVQAGPGLARPTSNSTRSDTVLVCDDDSTSRMLLVHMLRQRGLVTLDTGQAETALSIWRAGGIRAIVTDLDMPGMDGRALLKAVRAEESAQSARTVLIVCSGSAFDGAALGLGSDAVVPLADACLLKPVDVDTLAAVLARLGIQAEQATAPAA